MAAKPRPSGGEPRLIGYARVSTEDQATDSQADELRAAGCAVIHAEHASKRVQELGEDESYVLEVSATGAKLSAANPLGILHGLQSFLQLIEVTPTGFTAVAVHIEDTPRFPWRGLMIDG